MDRKDYPTADDLISTRGRYKDPLLPPPEMCATRRTIACIRELLSCPVADLEHPLAEETFCCGMRVVVDPLLVDGRVEIRLDGYVVRVFMLEPEDLPNA